MFSRTTCDSEDAAYCVSLHKAKATESREIHAEPWKNDLEARAPGLHGLHCPAAPQRPTGKGWAINGGGRSAAKTAKEQEMGAKKCTACWASPPGTGSQGLARFTQRDSCVSSREGPFSQAPACVWDLVLVLRTGQLKEPSLMRAATRCAKVTIESSNKKNFLNCLSARLTPTAAKEQYEKECGRRQDESSWNAAP